MKFSTRFIREYKKGTHFNIRGHKKHYRISDLPGAITYSFIITDTSKPQKQNAQSFCTECGSRLIGGDKFCRECGTPVIR